MKTILNKIRNRNNAAEKLLPEIPAGTRIYCIGDIHGRDDLLLVLENKIIEDSLNYTGRKLIVFLGDYIDRGMGSKEVVNILTATAFLPEFDKIFLCGNHEQTLLDFLNIDSLILKDWWHYGAQTTFYSYGVAVAGIPSESKFTALQTQLIEAIPLIHLEFFQSLSSYFVAGDYFFVHAGIKPGVTLARQSDMDFYWIREEFLNSKKKHEKIIVHGHSIVSEPEILPNRIGIDTGAYLSGNLTCLVLENETLRILSSA